MSAYRDDREALREQLEDLRRELEGRKGDAEDDARLRALGERVDRALVQVTRDREVLRQLADEIAALRGEAAEPERPAEPAPRHKQQLWLLSAGAAIALGAFFALRVPQAQAPPPPAPPAPPLGDVSPHAVDPLDFYARAAALANGKDLTEIRLSHVASDGMMDLDSPRFNAFVRYRFAAAPAAGDADAPVRAALVDVTGSGVYLTNEANAFAAFNQPVPKPTCSTAKVWAAASAAGAPADGVAQLTYHRRIGEKRPIWEFDIEGSAHSFTIGDPECRVLAQGELAGR